MPIRAGRSRSHPTWMLTFLAVAGLLLAACGAPDFTYVTNSAEGTYLKIPNSWRPIDQRSLDDFLGLDPAVAQDDRGLWTVGFDADATPSTLHLFGPHAEAPAVLVIVQQVPPDARGSFSLDRLRDAVYPVTMTARQRTAADPTSTLADFGLLVDDVLTPGNGLRGVHTVYRYRMSGGPLQIFDQTVYLNDDASKLYLVMVRCSTECYRDRQQEITSVVSSFTVREKP